jgi:predicted DNA-binding ribbon-helix-helix protein
VTKVFEQGRLRKRSISIQGHRTSIALEPVFWTALEGVARTDKKSLAELVAEIDEARTTGLASAIRVWLFERERQT